MGIPSDSVRSARRPGKRERARVKKRVRAQLWSTVGGAGSFRVKAGRKKFGKVAAYCQRLLDAHLGGDSAIPKSGVEIRRPLYTISTIPLSLSLSLSRE